MENWLKILIPKLISYHQNAFVLGRQIQYCVLVAHEAFHHVKLKRRGNVHEMDLKMDMNKAYDWVK